MLGTGAAFFVSQPHARQLSTPALAAQNPDNLGSGTAGSNVAAQIYVDAFEARFSNQTGGLVCVAFNVVAMFLCAHPTALNTQSSINLMLVHTLTCTAIQLLHRASTAGSTAVC